MGSGLPPTLSEHARLGPYETVIIHIYDTHVLAVHHHVHSDAWTWTVPREAGKSLAVLATLVLVHVDQCSDGVHRN
jgi:hypothetical protein